MIGLMREMNSQVVEFLRKQGVLTPQELDRLFEYNASGNQWIGQIALDAGIISDFELASCLANELSIPFFDPAKHRPDFEALKLLSVEACRDYDVLPIGFKGKALRLATFNPLDKDAISELASKCFPVTLLIEVAPQRCLGEYIENWYKQLADNHVSPAMPTTVPQVSSVSIPEESDITVIFDDLLAAMVEADASDLHLTVGLPPLLRVDGVLQRMPYPVLTMKTIEKLVFPILTPENLEKFKETRELDCSHFLANIARFRVNLFIQRNSPCAIFRLIPSEIPTLDSLGMPEVLKELTNRPRGLVLVTGPTGAGKSTTLAAMINEINATHNKHVITLEDPIEFVHKHLKCEINQRQVGTDTKDFATGLRQILRQDPDVILIGEMRDLETVAAALTAANTGHLVFATLHTTSAEQTINRIIDVFPPFQQDQVRSQLSMVLEGVIAQTLVPRRSGNGRCCAQEILMATPAVRNLIRENKIYQITSLMQVSKQNGMQTLDQALELLVEEKKISHEVAKSVSNNQEE